MKILCGPDLHIRVKAPEHRIDDFVAAQHHKIWCIINLARKWKCELILFPGDVTDHSRLPYWITDHYIRVFKDSSKDKFIILTVRGQHDMLYHVESENTPISVMDAAEALQIIGKHPLTFAKEDMGYVCVYGASWEEDIPEIQNPDELQTNILLIHKMFVADKLWEGQQEYERANIFLRKSKWDLIVSGDNHQHFMFLTGKSYKERRFHVNCGSLMRQKIDQKHHNPVVYIYDTADRTLAPHYIPIDPIEEVMDLEKAQEDKRQNEELQAFVESIEETTEIAGLDFVKNIDERLSQDDITDGVRQLGQKVMRKAGERI